MAWRRQTSGPLVGALYPPETAGLTALARSSGPDHFGARHDSAVRRASPRQMSFVSGRTTNVGRPASCSRRGAAELAGCALMAADGAAPDDWGLLTAKTSRFGDGDGRVGNDSGGGAARARPSRERFAVVRGASLAASSRTRRRYVRRAATETGTPRSESIAATAVQL
jgi:hypothetical protein